MLHAKPTAIPLTFRICKLSFPFSLAFSLGVQWKLIYSLIDNFSNQHKFNFGQYDSFSRLESFGDILGHGIILFLIFRCCGHKALPHSVLRDRFCWSLSDSTWISMVRDAKWVQNKLLLVAFQDSLIPCVLDTSELVTWVTCEKLIWYVIQEFSIQEEKTSKCLPDSFRPFKPFADHFSLKICDLVTCLHGATWISNQCYKPVTFLDLVIFQ